MIDDKDLKILKTRTEKEITVEANKPENLGTKVDDKGLGNISRTARRMPHEKTLNETIGDAIKGYDKKLQEEQEESGLKVDIDNYTMQQICNHMRSDDATKHQEFRNMEDSFMIVANYSHYLKQAKKNGQDIRDYRDAIRMAESAARRYQVNHKSLFFFTDYGKERYKISCRILDILEGLKSETATAHEAFLKAAQDKVDSASVEEIIDEKELTDKEKGKLIDKWITEGDEYKELIKKIINSRELGKVDLETLERIIVDKNNILIANKVTLSLIKEENPHLTLGLSGFKNKLVDFVNEKLGMDEESQKCIFSDVEDFRKKLRTILDDYGAENKELLEQTKQRKAKFVKELGIDEYDQRFWVREDINALLIDSEPEAFDEKLRNVKQRSDYNFEIIEQLVSELEFSVLSAKGVMKKIKDNLGDLLLYGGEMEVARKVKESISYLAFLAPEEFAAEDKISRLMNLYQVPKTDRDAFARYLSGKTGLKGIVGMSESKLQKKAAIFVKNLGGISKKKKIFRINKQLLKVETWEQIEKLKMRMGEFSDEEFKNRLDKLIEANSKTIDLRKPNVKYSDYSGNRQEIRRKRNIGFSGRILGELFLESPEVSALLDENETQYFRKNLIKKLCPDDSSVSEMEFLPTSEIKLIAGLLKENLTLMELKDMPQEVIDKVQEDLKEKVKETSKSIAISAFGEEKFKELTEKFESLKEFGQTLYEKVNFVIGKINKYKVFINGFRDIYHSIQNKKLLSEADERAHSKKVLKQDEKTLKKAEEVQNERQKKITANVVEEHRNMQKLSRKTAKTKENLAITKDIINMSMALGEEIFGEMDAGLATSLVKTAVSAGIDFALYCIRCIKDKNMLKTYYTETEKGKETVQKIKDGYTTLTDSREVTERDLKDKSVLDIVCAGKGYEKTEELILDTGNKMATSIAFCASKYNPIKETKVMACTVMVVLGLKSSIGKTDAGTISEIFNKMKAA